MAVPAVPGPAEGAPTLRRAFRSTIVGDTGQAVAFTLPILAMACAIVATAAGEIVAGEVIVNRRTWQGDEVDAIWDTFKGEAYYPVLVQAALDGTTEDVEDDHGTSEAHATAIGDIDLVEVSHEPCK